MNDACLAKCNLNTDVLQKHKVIIVMSLATINMCSLVSSLHYYIVTSAFMSQSALKYYVVMMIWYR